MEREEERAFCFIHRTFERAVETGAIEGDPLTALHLARAQVYGAISIHLADKLIIGRGVEDLVEAALPSMERKE